MGADAIDKTGNPLPDATIESCLKTDAVLFGAIGHPKYDNDPTAKVRPEQGLLKLRKSIATVCQHSPHHRLSFPASFSPLKSKAWKKWILSFTAS